MNSENPIISIIIPVYNASKYLRSCLNSILSQSFHDIELLCIDDGSTDDSLDILDTFSKLNPRVHVFPQKNSGPAKARNVGLENARGEYIMFCDADDTYCENMCETMLKAIEKHNVDMVMCNTNGYDKNGKECYSGYYFPIEEGKYQITDYIKQKTNVYLWNKIFRKSLIDNFGISSPMDIRLMITLLFISI